MATKLLDRLLYGITRYPRERWDYVNNENNGFMGFWWSFLEKENLKIYLQIEQEKLCCKIEVKENEKQSLYRNNVSSHIIEKSEHYNFKFKKPNRFGVGKTMTVAILDTEYRKNNEGIVDIKQTGNHLKEITNFLEEIIKDTNF